MSSLKANTITAATTNGDVTIEGNGTGGVVTVLLDSQTPASNSGCTQSVSGSGKVGIRVAA